MGEYTFERETRTPQSEVFTIEADDGTDVGRVDLHYTPTIINRVVFPDRSTVNLGNTPHKRVFTDGETYTATKVLETVIQSGNAAEVAAG